MGLFYTVHDADRSAQTKAFGKNLYDYQIGDAVTVAPVWTPEAPQYGQALSDTDFAVEGLVGPNEDSDSAGFQEPWEPCWIIVRDGHISAISDTRPNDLDLFDYRGHPRGAPSAEYQAIGEQEALPAPWDRFSGFLEKVRAGRTP